MTPFEVPAQMSDFQAVPGPSVRSKVATCLSRLTSAGEIVKAPARSDA